jgi:uncharacterized protein with FMN-binding domain
MKKVILLVSFAFAAFMSHAADNEKSLKNDVKDQQVKSIKMLESKTDDQQKSALCSVTLKGVVNAGVFSVEISCTNSAESCEQATKLSASCLTAALKTVKDIIY